MVKKDSRFAVHRQWRKLINSIFVKCKIKRSLSEKEEKAGMKARKPRDPESPKGFPGGLTRRP